MPPEVSVIVPNYNHARYLKQRIDSILAQTCQNFELILLDDASTDNSRELLEQYRGHPKVKALVFNTANSGSTFAQWQKGLLLAEADWVWIAESDDYAEPTFLETLLDLIEPQQNIGIAFCNSHWVDHHSEVKDSLSLYQKSFFQAGPKHIKNELCKHCTIQNASSAIIKRDLALKAVNNLGNYRACGDWIFYTRILQQSDIVYTSKILNYFRWYHNNVSNAGKDTLWATEGVQVLQNIDYQTVKFSLKEYLKLIAHWQKKVTLLSIPNRFKTWLSIADASMRYLHLKS